MRLDTDPRLPLPDDIKSLKTRLYEVLRLIASANNAHSDGYVSGVAAVTAAYTVQAGDAVVLADASGGAYAVTLQAPGQHKGKRVAVRKTDGGINAVTVTPPTGTIDGAATLVLIVAAPRCDVVSDGTNFFTV